MAEIAALPRNGLRVASTFAGAGGSCLGYRMAGYEIAWANEFEPNAAEDHRLNHPACALDTRSVRDVSGADIIEACGGVPDVLDGSPPCQSFSTAGARQKGWGTVIEHADGTVQRSDDLFFEYVRLLTEVRPRAFVAENVPGLASGTSKGMFKRIRSALIDAGYRVEARRLDASWLGVPQQRRRIFFIGLRDDLGRDPAKAFPRPLRWRYSIAEACPWLVGGEYTINPRSDHSTFQAQHGTTGQPAPTITAARERHMAVLVQPRNGRNFGERTTSLDGPAPTVLANTQTTDGWRVIGRRVGFNGADWQEIGSIHEPMPTVQTTENLAIETQNSAPVRQVRKGWHNLPNEGRNLTIIEVKRLCSFPDDYVLVGTRAKQWARLGNSVPPLMMRAVARSLAECLS